MECSHITFEPPQQLPSEVLAVVEREIEILERTIARHRPKWFDRVLRRAYDYSTVSVASIEDARANLPLVKGIYQESKCSVVRVQLKDIGVVWAGDESEDWPMFYCGTTDGVILTFDGLCFLDDIVAGTWPSTELICYWMTRANGKPRVIGAVASGAPLNATFTWKRDSCSWPYRPSPPYFVGEISQIASARDQLKTVPVDDLTASVLQRFYEIVH
jgi:hypothetical protein